MDEQLTLIQNNTMDLRNESKLLEKNLTDIENDLAVIRSNCSALPLPLSDCANIGEGLAADADFSTLPDVDSQLENIRNVANQDFAGSAQEVHICYPNWPCTDYIPTTYQPCTNHIPTTYQPHTNHILTIYWPDQLVHLLPMLFFEGTQSTKVYLVYTKVSLTGCWVWPTYSFFQGIDTLTDIPKTIINKTSSARKG